MTHNSEGRPLLESNEKGHRGWHGFRAPKPSTFLSVFDLPRSLFRVGELVVLASRKERKSKAYAGAKSLEGARLNPCMWDLVAAQEAVLQCSSRKALLPSTRVRILRPPITYHDWYQLASFDLDHANLTVGILQVYNSSGKLWSISSKQASPHLHKVIQGHQGSTMVATLLGRQVSRQCFSEELVRSGADMIGN